MDNAKKHHYQRVIDDKHANAKDLFKAFNTLTCGLKPSVYPQAKSDKDIANKFVNFLKEKNEKKIAKHSITLTSRQRNYQTKYPTFATNSNY